jgi:acyl-CoA synthetase (AMP-forming)/AMP-acid ligase II
MERTFAIATDGGATAVMTTSSLLPKLKSALDAIPGWRSPALIASDMAGPSGVDHGRIDVTSEDLAFLQYTSGSTSNPKGVIVSHANLADNLSRIRKDFGFSRSTCFVNWLPAYHDMGLIGGILEPLYAGCRTVLMSPQEFIQRPVRWLRLISKYKGTISGAPNFAYEACVARVPAKQMDGLDLSSWRVAFNGSEPIRAAVIEAFAGKFAPYGFDPGAMFPCYGLAESTLLVSCKGERTSSPQLKLDRAALRENRAVRVEEDQSGRTLVSCGGLIDEHSVAIVDPETRCRCAEGEIGEIWLSGPSVARGYWQRPDSTESAFRATPEGEPNAHYLRTGDLGVLDGGELYIAGRVKNIVIIRGLNYSCEDIEELAQGAHPALQGRLGAAFGAEDGDKEGLVVVQEIGRGQAAGVVHSQVRAAVQQAIVTHCGIRAIDLVLVKSASLPRTTSGKVKRQKARELYLDQKLSLVNDLAFDGARAGDPRQAI